MCVRGEEKPWGEKGGKAFTGTKPEHQQIRTSDPGPDPPLATVSRAMAKELGPYEGGAGGKLRTSRVASARRLSTPYDRPQTGRHAPAALRNVVDARRGDTWFAKIVDPASRIIANSAVRLFSSVFRKRLPATSSNKDADATEVQEDSIQEVPEEAVENTIGMEAIEKSREAIHGDQQGSEPELTKLEQLLKNKTFSRDEFNRLTELMQSRIVDSSSGLNDYEEKMREELHGRDGPNNAAANSEAQRWREERKKAREEKEICLLDNGLFGNASSPAVPPNISDDVGSSPADIAKAYMGVRPFRASPSTLALQGRTIRDEGAPSRLNSLPIVPRTEGWPVGNGQLEDRYKTPQSARVRSRIHGIARTPYTRNIPHQTSVQRAGDGFPSSTPSSRWTPIQTPLTGGRQMLKRRSSVLDDGFASVGPIRRTRMKSTFTTPSTKPDPSAPNDNQLIPLLSPRYDSSRNALSIKRTSEMERQIDVFPTFPARDNVTKSMGVGLAFVPPQSSETARKILEHLDRMVPSPKEKSAEAQLAIARDKSPSQLTVSMLNGHARRSTEIIDVAPFLDMHGTSSSAVQTYNQSLVDGVSGGDQKYIGKGKAPLFNSMAMPKEMPTSSGAGNATSQAPDTVCARLEANSAVPDSTLIVPEKSRGFRMSALEESDDEGYGSRKSPTSFHSQTGKVTSATSDGNGYDFKSSKADKPTTPLFGGKTSASSVSTPRAEANAANLVTSAAIPGDASANNISGFTFPVAPATSSFSEPPPTPTPMPSPLSMGNEKPKMANLSPTFNFASTSTSKGPVFSFATSGSTDVDTTKPKFDFKFESKPESSFSSTAVAAAAAAESASTSQTTFGSESLGSILKGPPSSELSGVITESTATFPKFGGSSSSLSSSSNFSTSTAVTTSSTAAPLFGVLASKTGGMNVPLFSSPGLSSSPSMTVMNNTNLAAPSSITQSEPSSVAGTGHPFKSLTNGDQNTSKFPNQTASGSSSPSSSLFGVTNVTSSMSSSATQTSNSANSLLPNSQLYSAASMPVQASGSAPAAISAPFGIGNSASLPSILSSTSSTSLLSSSSSLSFGSTGSLFGATPASSLSSSSLGSFGLSAPIPFSSASAPSFGLSSSTFGTSTPAQCGSGIPQTPGSGSTSMFGSTTSPSLVSSGISSFGGSSVPSFGLSSTPQLGSGTSSSFGLSTTQFGSSASPSFGLSTTQFGSSASPSFGLSTTPQFGSSSSPSFGMSSTQFGSSTSPSFGSGVNFGLSATSSFASASTPSFGSGSTPSFGSGSTPSFSSGSIFGSGSSPLFGGSSVSFGSSSTPSFVSGSTPSFGLTPSFGASTATSSTQSPTPSFGSGFGATPSSAATAFSFGGSAAASSGSFQFAASGNTTAGSTFLFNSSTGASPSTFTFSSKDSSPVPRQSMFGLANSPPTFGAAPSTTSNDQMNMEDSMAEDPAQLSSPTPSVFGQSASPASAPFLFSSQTSSAAAGQSVFQFGAQSTPVASNPFAAGAQSTLPPAGGLEFPAGGFSLGAGGEKSGRRIIKAKRDKGRRK
eukprot:Gb_18080 [translate_table: standard]